jgi:hypothetical protein
VLGSAVEHSVRLQVGTLMLVAITISAICDGTLQMMMHVITDNFFQ